MIYDKNDDIGCNGFINYLPILQTPDPNTPTCVNASAGSGGSIVPQQALFALTTVEAKLLA